MTGRAVVTSAAAGPGPGCSVRPGAQGTAGADRRRRWLSCPPSGTARSGRSTSWRWDHGGMAGDARLFVLATLDRLGEAHGHEVTREAAQDQLERWGHVSQGALYSALRRCEATGLVTDVRVEQVGRFPARTIYRLTDAGRAALQEARTTAWRRTGLPADPFDLALSVSDGGDPAVLREVVEQRLTDYTRALAVLRSEFDALHERLEPTAVAVFEHSLMRHETEIAWHRRLLERVDGFGTARGPAVGA